MLNTGTQKIAIVFQLIGKVALLQVINVRASKVGTAHDQIRHLLPEAQKLDIILWSSRGGVVLHVGGLDEPLFEAAILSRSIASNVDRVQAQHIESARQIKTFADEE